MNVPATLLWSFVGTMCLTTLLAASQAFGVTRMSLPYLLGTMFTPDRDRARLIGFLVHFVNGWLFALGGEYQWSDRLTLRSGVAYEISPITDQVRTLLPPDNNRIWASIGASWQVWRGFSFDLAYSHVWVKDPSVNITAASGNPSFSGVNYIGASNAHADVLSVAAVVRWGAPEPLPAVKPIISK